MSMYRRSIAYFTTRESFTEGGLISVNHEEIKNDGCCICCRPYNHLDSGSAEEPEEPVRLRCSHIFGKACIILWTKESNTCPTCRAVLFTEHLRPLHRRSSNGDLSPESIESDSDGASVGSLEPISNWTELWYELMGITRPSSLRVGPSREVFDPLRGFPWNMQRNRRRRSVSTGECMVCFSVHGPERLDCRSASAVQLVQNPNTQAWLKLPARAVTQATGLLCSIPAKIVKIFSRRSSLPALKSSYAPVCSSQRIPFPSAELPNAPMEGVESVYKDMVTYRNAWIREYMEGVEVGCDIVE